MEKIYHETAKRDDNYEKGNPCVSIKTFRPNMNLEEGMPSVIVLEEGRLDGSGRVFYHHTKYITPFWDHEGAQLIRKSIEEFDKFKEEVYTTAEAEAKSG